MLLPCIGLLGFGLVAEDGAASAAVQPRALWREEEEGRPDEKKTWCWYRNTQHCSLLDYLHPKKVCRCCERELCERENEKEGKARLERGVWKSTGTFESVGHGFRWEMSISWGSKAFLLNDYRI